MSNRQQVRGWHSLRRNISFPITRLAIAAVFLLSVLLACTMTAPAFADKEPPRVPSTAPAGPPARAGLPPALPGDALVDKMLENGKASEANNMLVRLSGDWYYTASVWTAPGDKLVPAMGKITNDWIMDGRFMSSTIVGSLSIGQRLVPVKGQGLIGYDNAKKSYSSVWVDTLTTGMMIGSGKYDKKTKAIRETGQFTNPLTGAPEAFRSELEFTDAEHYKRTIFATGRLGRETKLMEFDFSKRP